MLYLNRNLSALSLDSLVILSLGKFSWDTGKLLDYSLPYIAQTSDQHMSLGSGILWKEGFCTRGIVWINSFRLAAKVNG